MGPKLLFAIIMVSMAAGGIRANFPKAGLAATALSYLSEAKKSAWTAMNGPNGQVHEIDRLKDNTGHYEMTVLLSSP